MMSIFQTPLREATRRQFFANTGISIGSLGLASLLADGQLLAQGASSGEHPLQPRLTHFAPRATNVIFLFMAGGPSHLDLFDYKPKLQDLNGQMIPASYVENKRFAFLKKDAKLLGTRRKFRKWGQSGTEISELLPHIGSIADQITLIRTMKTEVFNFCYF